MKTTRTVAGLLIAMWLSAGAQAQTGDPILGKWYGQAGFPTDRIEVGFEFRAEGGQIVPYFYEPVVNFYALKLEPLKREGDAYVGADLALNVTLKDGKLEGTMFGLGAPLTLSRTEQLPAEYPIPELPRGPGPKWQAKLGGSIYAPAALRDGVAYVGSTTGLFHAVRIADGSFAWSFAAGRPILGEALATAAHVYFACDDGNLYKLDRASGKEAWRYDLGDSRASRFLPHQVVNDAQFDFDIESSRPVLVENVLYIASGDGSLHAIDADNGKRAWRHEGVGKARTTPFVDATRVYYGTLSNFMYGVDRKTGARAWERDVRAMMTTSPVMIGDKLLGAVRGGVLAAFDPATGKTTWRLGFWGSAVESEIAPVDGGRFYVGSSDMRRVLYVDSADARVLWRADVFGWAWARPLPHGKRVYATTAGVNPYQIRHFGAVTALDAATGRIEWRWPIAEAPGAWMNGFLAGPAIEKGTLVVGGLDGTLYGFEVEP